MSLAIVTATTDWPRATPCVQTWMQHARGQVTLYIVGQNIGGTDRGWETIATNVGPWTMHGYTTKDILGVVPAYSIGVARALADEHDVIACLHDDLEIHDPAWDLLVCGLFEQNPQIGLCGFGGGLGLGDSDIYQKPYNPMQLARRGFVSNMRDATAHGARSLQPLKVACLDGFSQIGRAGYWKGRFYHEAPIEQYTQMARILDHAPSPDLFSVMASWGIVHHAYDAALGCFAKRLGWETWMLPVACHHYGGRTAVGDPNYQAWANEHKGVIGEGFDGTTQVPITASGDQYFWHKAHRIVYDQFTDVLPIN